MPNPSRALRRLAPLTVTACLVLVGTAQAVSPPGTVAQALNAARAARGLPKLPDAQVLATAPAKMYEALNTARIHNGLRPFEISESLTLATTHWVRFAARRHLYQHEKYLGVPGFTLMGDIIARMPGKRPGVQAVADAWMASPEHSPIILDRQFNTMGVAVLPVRYGRKWWMIWDVRFGRP